jgi:hypothetical protein
MPQLPQLPRHTTTPQRVVVRAPRSKPSTLRPIPAVRDLDERSEYGEVLLRSLVRAQLGLTLGFAVLAAGVLAALPLLATLLPWLVHRQVAGLPLPLIVLGIGVYPVLVALAYLYVRLAERTDRHFTDLVERS